MTERYTGGHATPHTFPTSAARRDGPAAAWCACREEVSTRLGDLPALSERRPRDDHHSVGERGLRGGRAAHDTQTRHRAFDWSGTAEAGSRTIRAIEGPALELRNYVPLP